MGEIPEWVVTGKARQVETKRKPANGEDEAPPPTPISGRAIALKDYPPTEWLIEELVPFGLIVFAGKPKIGKSWLALQIALSCAIGTPTFGRLSTMQCGVLYLALEDGEKRIHARQDKMLRGELPPDDIEYVMQWPAGMRGLECLGGYLDGHPRCRLVIVDPWAKIRGEPDGRKGVYQQDYQDMGELHAFATQRNICLVLVLHTRKMDASDVLDRISGSTAIQGAADANLVLERKRNEALGQLSVHGRDIINGGDFAMSWDRESCRWTLLGEARQVQKESEQDRVFQFLQEQKEPVTVSEIVDALEMNRSTVKSALNRLAKRGSIYAKRKDAWQAHRGDAD